MDVDFVEFFSRGFYFGFLIFVNFQIPPKTQIKTEEEIFIAFASNWVTRVENTLLFEYINSKRSIFHCFTLISTYCTSLRSCTHTRLPGSTSILTLRRLMSYIYIYMEHPFLMFLDHTQRRSTVGRTPLDE